VLSADILRPEAAGLEWIREVLVKILILLTSSSKINIEYFFHTFLAVSLSESLFSYQKKSIKTRPS
jgi:hypothetical protein